MKYKMRFLIVQENLTPLLGLNATEKMGLLTVHKENFISVVEEGACLREGEIQDRTTKVAASQGHRTCG